MGPSNANPTTTSTALNEIPGATKSSAPDGIKSPIVKSEALRKRVGTPFSSPKAAKDRSSLDAKNKAGVDSSSSATGAGSISVSVNSKTDVVPSSSSIELTKSQTVLSSGSVAEPTSATTTSSATGDSISSSHSRERKTNFDDKKKSSHERTGELSNASSDPALAKKKEETQQLREGKRKRSKIVWLIVVVAFIGIAAGVATLITLRIQSAAEQQKLQQQRALNATDHAPKITEAIAEDFS
ncbi:endochitinase A1-like [Varroa jacobsoni]|uniref:endochitinase A1-like n=1 Tax=Varroa jacobsoni TaxID=62625 RepID=UPI000BF49EDB|nr:endochitinase A1-like [Varroa jacobsoni]